MARGGPVDSDFDNLDVDLNLNIDVDLNLDVDGKWSNLFLKQY